MANIEIPADVRVDGIDINRHQELGRGSDASVFSGTWYGAPVAVKVLHDALIAPENVGREEFLQKFRGECERLRSLRHPYVVQFLGVFMHNNAPALVTEKMEMTLQAFYERKKTMSFSVELRLLKESASGLAYIHSQGMLHRDLTTRNVLVTADWRAKLADVGMSRVIHGPGGLASALASASALTRAPGTLVYMSPESIIPESSTDNVVYGEKLDVFSFAVVMTSLIGRREPSPALLLTDRFETVDGVRRAIPEVERRAKDLAGIPKEHALRGLILRCMENDPAKRPPTGEVLKAISDVVVPGGELVGGTREQVEQKAFKLEVDLLAAESRCQNAERQVLTLQRSVEEQEQQRSAVLAKTTDIAKFASKIGQYQATKNDIFGSYRRLPFSKKWRSINLPPSCGDCDVWFEVVRGALYVLCIQKDGSSALYRTENTYVENWVLLATAGGENDKIDSMNGIVSHQGHLYAITTSGGVQGRLVPQLVILREKSNAAFWEPVENSQVPFFGDSSEFEGHICSSGVSIVLLSTIGGTDLVAPSILEYSTTEKNWLTCQKPVPLPEPILPSSIFFLNGRLHLMGESAQLKGTAPDASIFSMSLYRSTDGWQTESFSVPLRKCGLGQVYGHLVAVGGMRKRGYYRGDVDSKSVFLFDWGLQEWLDLPLLNQPTTICSPVSTAEMIVALTGNKSSGERIEILDIQL